MSPQPILPAPHTRIARREFLSASALLAFSAFLEGCQTEPARTDNNSIIDIHQHVGYSRRTNDVLLAHQEAMGITLTILLPAGRPYTSPSTHNGTTNGLEAQCLGNADCFRFAQENKTGFLFGANEVPDAPDAVGEIEKYLKRGAVVIGEQKFGIDCDSPQMQCIYDLAADYRVPVLMHWQYKMYNYGFERFYKMLEKHPKTMFIGHAQTWWANIDKNYKDDASNLYPKGPVTPGGLTDLYLSDFPNMFGDLSAGSGLNALTRDPDHARDFLTRHQNKLLYGSDCNDPMGQSTGCQGMQTIAAVRRLAATKKIERKLLCENARHLFRL